MSQRWASGPPCTGRHSSVVELKRAEIKEELTLSPSLCRLCSSNKLFLAPMCRTQSEKSTGEQNQNTCFAPWWVAAVLPVTSVIKAEVFRYLRENCSGRTGGSAAIAGTESRAETEAARRRRACAAGLWAAVRPHRSALLCLHLRAASGLVMRSVPTGCTLTDVCITIKYV